MSGAIGMPANGFCVCRAKRRGAPKGTPEPPHGTRRECGKICAAMTLYSGDRIGPYEIRAEIGAGGMGVVYRAHDARLKRDVALKILPESFAADPERLARFQREAEVMAALQHPNIAAIYGLEETADVRALVMELVEGSTLAERIAERRGSTNHRKF
jgi:serine/threonine protein kinase